MIKQHQNDWQAEFDAIALYNNSIRLTAEAGDNRSRELIESMLKEEESHLDWIEAQQEQIGQIGIENYLAEQIDA